MFAGATEKGGGGGNSLRGFHASPASLPVINPLTLELGAGTEVSAPESAQCPSLRRSRKEFVYTHWAFHYLYIYTDRLRHSGSMINSTTTSLRTLTGPLERSHHTCPSCSVTRGHLALFTTPVSVPHIFWEKAHKSQVSSGL